MKAMLRSVIDKGVRYKSLVFACPGCVAGGPEGYDGIHSLPVNATGLDRPSWDWDGNLEAPTLSPSILTNKGNTTESPYPRCHSFLRSGVFEFLVDSTHPLAGQHVPMPDLPDWVVAMTQREESGEDER